MTPGPIKPTEVQDKKDLSIPDEVYNVFNDLITEHWSANGSSSVPQDEAVARICRALDITRQVAFDKGYLEIESAYRKAGWKVKYEKPDPGEGWGAFFVFSK